MFRGSGLHLRKIQVHHVCVRGVLRTERFVKMECSHVILVHGPTEACHPFRERGIPYSIHKHPADTFASVTLLDIEVNDIEVTDIITIVASREENIPNQSGCIFSYKAAKDGIAAETVGEILLRTEAVLALVSNTTQIVYKLPKECLDSWGV